MKILTVRQFAMPRKWHWFAAFVVVLSNALASAEEPRVVDATFLENLRWEVRTNHPTVAAAQSRAEAASAEIRAVRLWEDPMVGVSVMAAEREMRRDDGDLIFMADQMLPRSKLYRARKAKAEAEYSVMQAETRSAVLDLETMVAQAAVELALADEMLAIETNQLTWLESMAVNAGEKLKDPMSSAAEPLRIEGEVAQERQRVDSSIRNRRRLMRQLNILLGRAPDQEWQSLRLPVSGSSLPVLPDELSRLFQVNPMLQASVYTASAAKAEAEAARQERKPFFSLGAESRIYSGDGDFREAVVGAKVTLPWFNNSVYRANIERAQRQQKASEKETEALQRKLRSEAITAYTEAEDAARQADTFSNEVIPRVEKAVQATENAWISSKATLLEVLEARRALLNARLEQRRFVAAQRAALETLRSIVPSQTQPK